MKITVNAKSTRAGIKYVTGIIPKRSNLPILSNVHLYANGCFQVTATDLDVTLQARLSGSTLTEGKTTLPGKALADAVAGNLDVELETDDKNITTVRSGGAVRTVNGLPVEEFPVMPEMPTSALSATVPADLFIACLKEVQSSMSTDESRYVLNGVCLEIGPDAIKFIATDGRRLQTAVLKRDGIPLTREEQLAVDAAQLAMDKAVISKDNATKDYETVEKAFPASFQTALVPQHVTDAHGVLYTMVAHPDTVKARATMDAAIGALDSLTAELRKLRAAHVIILPAIAVKHVLRMPIDKKAPGNLTLSDWTVTHRTTEGSNSVSYARIDCGELSLTSKLIEGNYTNYRQVIPGDAKITVPLSLMDMAQFQSSLEIAEKSTTDKSNSVKLVFTSGQLEITANSPEVGSASVKMPVAYTGDEFSIAFNPAYLIDACEAFTLAGGGMVLNLIDELSPIRITNCRESLMVIMPMRLS